MSPEAASYQDPGEITAILRQARTVAIVGLSADELRASHFVGFYLRRHGYKVVPVNPNASEVLGQRSYQSLTDVPDHIESSTSSGGPTPCLRSPRSRSRSARERCGCSSA